MNDLAFENDDLALLENCATQAQKQLDELRFNARIFGL